MKPENFCYWLQGYFELSGNKSLNGDQVETIKRHLAMVFVHSIDPSLGGPEMQVKLQALHQGQVEPEPQVLMKC